MIEVMSIEDILDDLKSIKLSKENRRFVNSVRGIFLDRGNVPIDIQDKLRKLIRQGAQPNKETGEFEPWSNALHLVHKAYQVGGIQRPTPDMKDLWKQYEENIEVAVKELSKERGMDGGWRMSAADLHDK